MVETRAIKFYLDESVNNIKKQKVLDFLSECQTIENKLLEHYWSNFYEVLKSNTWITFYENRIMIREPRLKFHQYMHILKQVYEELKSLQTKIIKGVHFKFKEDKEKQKIYNYCAGFCFQWDRLEKYIDKQLKKYKKLDKAYYEFLLAVNNYIQNEELFTQLKQDIENQFWEVKSKHNQPMKKQFQIRCNTAHTVSIELKEFQWIFTIDNNTIVGGTKIKPVFDTMIIPVKFSNYHKKVLEGKQLANSFTLKLNRHGRIEIIGFYEIEVEGTKTNEIKEVIGIDIGLKKLIVSSDGEIIEQDKNILHKLSKVIKKQANRQTLEEHLKKKYDNENFKLGDKRYLLKQQKLSDHVKCENRYLIKQFLSSRLNDHIIIENLELAYSKMHSKEVNYLMKRLGIQGIKRDMIKYAKSFGIKISPINPAFTSQTCSKCGHVSKNNRKNQEEFCCEKCNHTDNADHNASVNIKNRYHDNRITLDMPTWKVADILGVKY